MLCILNKVFDDKRIAIACLMTWLVVVLLVVILILALVFVFTNLVVDLFQTAVDPRIKRS